MPWAFPPTISQSLQGVRTRAHARTHAHTHADTHLHTHADTYCKWQLIVRNDCFAPLVKRYLDVAFAVCCSVLLRTRLAEGSQEMGDSLRS